VRRQKEATAKRDFSDFRKAVYLRDLRLTHDVVEGKKNR
jgi:hypothetical protein